MKAYTFQKNWIEFGVTTHSKPHVPDFVFVYFILVLLYIMSHFMEKGKNGIYKIILDCQGLWKLCLLPKGVPASLR